MRKLMVAVGGALVLAAPLANADIVGVGASISYWDSELTGTAGKNSKFVDVDNELNLKNQDNVNLGIHIEHPIPLLPNVRLTYTAIEQSGRGELGLSGYDTLVAGPVRSDLELDQLDLTLYYELLDNWLNLDLGLTVRDLSGELTMTQLSPVVAASKTEIDAVLPMGYVAARFDLPMTGLAVGAEGNAIAYSGDSVYDFNAYAQYQLAVVRLRAGYRQMSIDYEDSNDKLDIRIGGPFLSAGLVF
ncbi:TIGR04219 family outer membrane beta-barrel protein [Marinobacter sp. X15-166B]|uniref:TIGR04219 family outer membrane beta-barrel protein n=1 Tax=Marinobacter sp. X15-166B TaxID=1897620 RepID=UPI00085C8B34|nr:TIGR04219 family outer membrane beta-barrel protein [Marinobacter sp. X15-166B]OEY67260.1 hypothetical protein BG841_12925 [Marinobacter sp. X15-166B]